MDIGSAIERRIRERAAELEYPIGELMQSAGLHYKYLEGLPSGKHGPTVGKLSKLRRILKVSWDWLLEGIGDAPGGVIRDDEPSQAQVPERDIRVAAGGGELVSGEALRRTWGLPQTFLYSLSLRAESIEFVEIVGNSMYPLLWPGDLALIDRRATSPDHRAVYALWDGDATVCKYVELDRSAKAPTYIISSENSVEHQAYKRRAADVSIAGRVVWFGRRLP